MNAAKYFKHTVESLVETMTLRTKTNKVFGCAGQTFHVISGVALLKANKGYRCPYCNAEVRDITDTIVGRAYFAIARPDLPYPPSVLSQ